MQIRKLLIDLRDRVIRGSQLGKRKLDLAFTRRELDERLRDLGERFRRLSREGRVSVPPDLEGAMARVRDLEERMASQQGEVARLEREATSEA
ncbi:MAG TPA: hypothetical protein VFR85_09395 [Anaeromyxobacteraceae bacterium]|nr:hypothetical protein [Anaeromyxobacteraceae bacterium]